VVASWFGLPLRGLTYRRFIEFAKNRQNRARKRLSPGSILEPRVDITLADSFGHALRPR